MDRRNFLGLGAFAGLALAGRISAAPVPDDDSVLPYGYRLFKTTCEPRLHGAIHIYIHPRTFQKMRDRQYGPTRRFCKDVRIAENIYRDHDFDTIHEVPFIQEDCAATFGKSGEVYCMNLRTMTWIVRGTNPDWGA